ncbi:hypothetical protein N7492_005804 [Penicillium capsulatum]|uniref:Short-chain dehydrogenase n=1 Tax=Penicillium capsulatum TaxID=69766 RepID=A0A9W9IAH1_9EURO|nr:hypothetical protein N7492_005804 [Penicillium capsulatum]KAJ6135096.1 hypothetical protein N7512_000256 [Penicillium capsulatum]
MHPPTSHLALEDAAAIAQRLREDQKLCQEKRLPSTLALRLPKPPSPLLDAVSRHLTPHEGVHRDLRSLRCQSLIDGIKFYLSQLNEVAGEPEEPLRSGQSHIPKTAEFATALKVLEYLQASDLGSSIKPSSPVTDVVSVIRDQLSMSNELRAEHHQAARRADKHRRHDAKRRCYMCRQVCSISEIHALYPALCRPCGDFNLGSSRLSLPDELDLAGKTALVTGGRINLGYHTALRLLRCGSRVIVSSRYPADAAMRYSTEPDFDRWRSRLKVVGADFRTARDAFQLVHVVKELLRTWDEHSESRGRRYLDILINNAAQTLTDPVKAEVKAISREGDLQGLPQAKALIATTAGHAYLPRLRGGAQASWVPGIENGTARSQLDELALVDKDGLAQKGLRTINDQDSGKSSWTQSMSEIPYEDLISAHSVNAFVPLILCRELLPCMGTDDPKFSSVPAAHIINVSSREGILEEKINSPSKAGHHVHTNMSKAAINMITETEASSAWHRRRIAMNTVDPGYMSAAPECQRPEGCPIGFEDGAARVLWPVVVAEREGRSIWGRFMKHFEEGTPIIRRGN